LIGSVENFLKLSFVPLEIVRISVLVVFNSSSVFSEIGFILMRFDRINFLAITRKNDRQPIAIGINHFDDMLGQKKMNRFWFFFFFKNEFNLR